MILSAVVMFGVAGGISVSAETLSGGFVVELGVLVDYVGPGGDVVIPNGVGITEIGGNAFAYCDTITSVVIPSSVEYIGYGSFAVCTSLESVSMSGDIVRIHSYAFTGCRSLVSVNISGSVKVISDWAFGDCTALASINIPESVKYIDDNVFYNCPLLTVVVERGSYAHQWCIDNDQPYVFAFISEFDDINDVFNILKLIVSGMEFDEYQVAAIDVNGDDKVAAADALLIMKSILGII